MAKAQPTVLIDSPRSSVRSEGVGEWRYGLTLVPRDNGTEAQDTGVTVEAVVQARRARGWELIRVTEKENAELLVFRQPA